MNADQLALARHHAAARAVQVGGADAVRQQRLLHARQLGSSSITRCSSIRKRTFCFGGFHGSGVSQWLIA